MESKTQLNFSPEKHKKNVKLPFNSLVFELLSILHFPQVQHFLNFFQIYRNWANREILDMSSGDPNQAFRKNVLNRLRVTRTVPTVQFLLNQFLELDFRQS